MMAIATSLKILGNFASPIGINRTLAFVFRSNYISCLKSDFIFNRYIEAQGSGAIVRPWFWITWLFIGPVMTALCQNMYLYFSSWILVRTEGLITHLLFEHSLRIRLKAGGVDSNANEPPADQDDKKNSGNMTGKINNLVTSDLNNIGRGSDFIEIGAVS